ncbi:MAG: response regulator [Pirellulales bacterium]
MSKTYFVQECPTCGRSLHVRVEYLGRRVTCQHCRGQFMACDPQASQASLSDSGLLMRRAEELLEMADQRSRMPPR